MALVSEYWVVAKHLLDQCAEGKIPLYSIFPIKTENADLITREEAERIFDTAQGETDEELAMVKVSMRNLHWWSL
jgi:hypothetical protein